MSRSARWTLCSLLGLAAWVGATVAVAATGDDPSDATPILRTFALCGGAFITLMLLAAGWEIRRSRYAVSTRLYRALAVREVPPAAVRAAARATRGMAQTYLVFAGATSALVFAAIGLGETGPYRLLLFTGFGLVLLWLGYAVLAQRRAYRAAGTLLAPLGLAVTEVPVASAGRLHGELRIAGRRHGRPVTIRQRPELAVTELPGGRETRSFTSPSAIAAMTGEPARHWRGVTAHADAGAVTVRRDGNGAGRWLLYDLLLGERLAG